MTRKIQTYVEDTQYALLEEMLGFYGKASVTKLCRYFIEKGIEQAQTKMSLHGQVDILSKLVEVASKETDMDKDALRGPRGLEVLDGGSGRACATGSADDKSGGV